MYLTMEKLGQSHKESPIYCYFQTCYSCFYTPYPYNIVRDKKALGFRFPDSVEVGFSHLREHKFIQGFLDIVDPICSCHTNAVENTEHYLFHCSNFANQLNVLVDDLQNIDISYGPLDSSTSYRLLLFGDPKFSENVHRGIIYGVIKFIESTNRFSGCVYN